MTWNFASALDIGDRDEQQDRVTVLHSGDAHLLVVADGMGGRKNGAEAAQTVIDVATLQFTRGIKGNPGVFLEKICLEADKAIRGLAKDNTSAPGSTCVMLYLEGDEAYWVHVGDSRMYKIQDRQLVYKTSDHSMVQLAKEHGQDILQGTHATPEQNQLYMCLGGKNEVIPEFSASAVRSGDLFLLCSDGLWSQTTDQELLAQCSDRELDSGKAEQLVELARQGGQGQSDNISLVWACRPGVPNDSGAGLLGRFTKWFQR